MQLREAGFETCDMLLLVGSAYKILKTCGLQPPLGLRAPVFERLANMVVVHALLLCAMDLTCISEDVIESGRRALLRRFVNAAEKRELFSHQASWANRMGSHCWYGEDESLGLRMD